MIRVLLGSRAVVNDQGDLTGTVTLYDHVDQNSVP